MVMCYMITLFLCCNVFLIKSINLNFPQGKEFVSITKRWIAACKRADKFNSDVNKTYCTHFQRTEPCSTKATNNL